MIHKIHTKLLPKISAGGREKLLVYSDNIFYCAERLRGKGFSVKKSYPYINAVYCECGGDELNKLSDENSVKFVMPDAEVFAMTELTREIVGIPAFEKNGYTGLGVTVAVIDTGISCHMDLFSPVNRLVCFKDFVNGRDKYYDDNGHGTFVCGVLCGNGFCSGGKYRGMAPDCRIIALKALNSKGVAATSDILDAVEWVIDNKNKYNIKVVNMSFGSDPLGRDDPLSKAAEALWRNGITVVASAGNSGSEYNTIKSPGINPYIITVGASNHHNSTEVNKHSVAAFSSRGSNENYIFKPDCVAPGVDIISIGMDKCYTSMSGTSVSAPVVSGLAALIIQRFPHIPPDTVKAIIKNYCERLCGDVYAEGSGEIRFV